MARVRFLVYPYKAERSQYLNVALHGGTIPLESYRQVRNWRRLQANRMDHSNALRCEYAQQVSGVFKGKSHLGSEFLAAIEPAGALKRSLEEVFSRASAHVEVVSGLFHLPSSTIPELRRENRTPAFRNPGT
jgi:hypothetical protein